MNLESINLACEDRSRGGVPGAVVRPVFFHAHVHAMGGTVEETFPVPIAADEMAEQRAWEGLKQAAVAGAGGLSGGAVDAIPILSAAGIGRDRPRDSARNAF